MKYERYAGKLVSSEGVMWEVKILQEASEPFAIRSLDMAGEAPLVIEWGETSKEEVICGSSATLKLLSPGDRTYEDLYSIEPGLIRMDVLREGVLYWSGTLDPEFYEEPYTRNEDYEVELTFSDLGILERLNYDLTGRQNCGKILEYIMSRSGINYDHIDMSGMTTTVAGSTGEGLAQLVVRSDNFYDEDGEASTLEEVLVGILQPLGLRILQKNGVIWVYDLHGAYTKQRVKKTEWQLEDQVMGVDSVLNNAKVTLSTYSESALMKGEITYPGEYSEDDINHTNDSESFNTYYVDYDQDNRDDVGNYDYNYNSFTIFYTHSSFVNKETGLSKVSAYYFHIQPLMGGSESDGVAFMFYTGGHGSLRTGWPRRIGGRATDKDHRELMKTHRVFVPTLDAKDRGNYYLRLTEEVLIDARYNPFTQAGDANEGGNYGDLEVWFGYVMIPAAVTLYDEDGKALYHYTNKACAESHDRVGGLSPSTTWGTLGGWEPGAANWGDCWLEWYDPEDRAEKSGVLGWKANRHCIGLSTRKMFKSFSKMDDGQYIPYPPHGGYIEVSIFVGIWPYDYGETTFGETNQANKKGLYDKIRWMLYKAPKLEVVKANTTKSAAEVEDIEYSSFINESAKEGIEIDTICGTAAVPCPTARGIFLNAGTDAQVREMTRAGRTTQVEQLLTGTLYSQYADRKTKLEGTVKLNDGDVALYRDAMQEGKKFICLGDVQDIQADESEVILVELRPDEYKDTNER